MKLTVKSVKRHPNYKISPKQIRKLGLQADFILNEILGNKRILKESKRNARKIRLLREKIEIQQYSLVAESLRRRYKQERIDFESRVIERFVKECKKIYGLNEEQAEILKEGFFDAVQDIAGRGAGWFQDGLKKLVGKGKLAKFLQKHNINIGVDPKDYEQTQRVFQKVLKDEANKVMKELYDGIQDAVQEEEIERGSVSEKSNTYPYNKHKDIFLKNTEQIAFTYDSIVKKYEEDPDYDATVANSVIRSLRQLVQKYISDLEREKGGMYATFGGDKKTAKSLSSRKPGDAEKAKAGEPNYTGGPKDMGDTPNVEDEGPDTLEEQEEGGGEAEKDPAKMSDDEFADKLASQRSEVAERLRSLKAPMIIAGVGAALGLGGLLAGSDWFQEAVKGIINSLTQKRQLTPVYVNKQVTQKITSAAKGAASQAGPSLPINLPPVKAGDGFVNYWNRVGGSSGGFTLVGKKATAQDMVKAIDWAGGGDPNRGIKNLMAAVDQGDKQFRGGGAAELKKLYDAVKSGKVSGSTGLFRLPKSLDLFKAGGLGSGAGSGANYFTLNPGFQPQPWSLSSLVSPNKLVTVTKKIIKRKLLGYTVKYTGGYGAAAAATLAGIAPTLGYLGIGSIAAGAAIAALRANAYKGGSRVGVMNTLLKYLNDVEPRKGDMVWASDPDSWPDKGGDQDQKDQDQKSQDQKDQDQKGQSSGLFKDLKKGPRDQEDTRVDPSIPSKMKPIEKELEKTLEKDTDEDENSTVDTRADPSDEKIAKKHKKLRKQQEREKKKLSEAFTRRNEQLFEKLKKKWTTNS